MTNSSQILDHFPLPNPRVTQTEVLKAIQKAFEQGYRNVLLEAPVGSGKSAIAVAAARWLGEAHILTPMKSLQDQYKADFPEIALMKGRGAYPCTYGEDQKVYNGFIKVITSGGTPPLSSFDWSCVSGPCLPTNYEVYKECTEVNQCPYSVAIESAQKYPVVLHNLHSFIFQTYFGDKFKRRKLLVIDECHKVEEIVRDFAAKTITLPKSLDLVPTKFDTISKWVDALREYETLFSDIKLSRGRPSQRDAFKAQLLSLEGLSETFGNKFVVITESDLRKTTFKFIPEKVSSLCRLFLHDFGEKRLLMSGTIYNKSVYCTSTGLNEEETCFLRIGSTFPKVNRPIYLKKDYLVDTSHKTWEQNFPEMIDRIGKILSIFHNVKGLVHTPSYKASAEIQTALLGTGRIVTHSSSDFQEKLNKFFSSKTNQVFLSPICQQGVDFKGDRARFQIILRVPYANISDKFTEFQVKNNFPWYNHQALVTFGQQLGRVNRGEDDYGVTVLLDERFNKFISQNKGSIPKWIMDSIITK